MVLTGFHPLLGSLSGNGKISCWQACKNARDYIQEAFCYLQPVSLKSSVTDALEKYVSKLYQPDSLSEGGVCFGEKQA